MEISLKHFMEIKALGSVPYAKYLLLQYKKRGHLFFTEDVCEMQLDDKFQIYYYLYFNTTSDRKAFPIPINAFSISTDNEERFMNLKQHFENYYLNDELDKEGFAEYDLKNPYIGEDYVWVCKRTS